MARSAESDWVSGFADDVVAEAERRNLRTVVCASGLSPSGPIHLGNLREVMTPHLVADEIRRRGYDCTHILSWDDYDRFRKVPAGVDPAWNEHIGKPLTSVPAPPGSSYGNWAEHFKAPMIASLEQLGIEVREISQTERYTSGAYRDQVLLAMRERTRIDAILARYRTKAPTVELATAGRGQDDDVEAALIAAEGSGAASEDDGKAPAGYFPYKPYCSVCGRDVTTVTSYDDATTELSYTCMCGHTETVLLSEHRHGKLVWKVDWPMRWSYEDVVFEPSGVDHNSPGSSFVVGGEIVEEVFGGVQPIGPMYAFVGITGMAKMSSSKGGVPTPGDALRVMERPLVRWLYARRRPHQSFKVAFDHELLRLYDEWDSTTRRVAADSASHGDAVAYSRAVTTATATMPLTPRIVSYRTLASIVDITTGDDGQIFRILRDMETADPIESLADVRPRLDCARVWVENYMSPDERTAVRTEPDRELLDSLDDAQRASVRMLVDSLDENWSLDSLTKLVYGVPKLQAGLPLDTAPTLSLKAAQREFFALLYALLIGRDTGPRLPTLILAIGSDRVRHLLSGAR